MKEFFFNTIQEFNDFIGVKTLHPLVSLSLIHISEPTRHSIRSRMPSSA